MTNETHEAPSQSRSVPDLPITAYLDEPAVEPTHFWTRPIKGPRNTALKWWFTLPEDDMFHHMRSLETISSQVQREIGAWAWANFNKGALGLNPLLGVIEELGELAHAILKGDLGIRGDAMKHELDAKDAIGDITVYLLNYLNTVSCDVGPLFASLPLVTLDRWYDCDLNVDKKHLVVQANKWVTILADNPARGAGELIVTLELLSRGYNTTLLAMLTSTWNIVKQRDWKKSPEDGGGHSHGA